MNRKIWIVLLFIISLLITGCNNDKQEKIYFNEVLEKHLYSEDISYTYTLNDAKKYEINDYKLLQGMIKMLYTNTRLCEIDNKSDKKYRKETEFVLITSKANNEVLKIKLFKDDYMLVDVDDIKYITKSSKVQFQNFTNFVSLNDVFFNSDKYDSFEIKYGKDYYNCTDVSGLPNLKWDKASLEKQIKFEFEYIKNWYDSLTEEELNAYEKRYQELGYESMEDYEVSITTREYFEIYNNVLNLRLVEEFCKNDILLLSVPYSTWGKEEKLIIDNTSKKTFVLSCNLSNKICCDELAGYAYVGYMGLDFSFYLLDASYLNNFYNSIDLIIEEIDEELADFANEIKGWW